MSKPVVYLTPQEVSERFGGRVSVRTLANWRHLGCSPPYRRIGGRILYPLAELEEWERKQTYTSTSNYGRSDAA